jgi:hypothetical protein
LLARNSVPPNSTASTECPLRLAAPGKCATCELVPDAENRPHHAEHDNLIARIDGPEPK